MRLPPVPPSPRELSRVAHVLADAARGGAAGLRDGLRGRNGRRQVQALREDGRGGEVSTLLTRDGVRLHVECDGPAGADVTVVFVHGFSLDLTNWRRQRAALQGSDVRRVFYDHRGFGRSGRGAQRGSMRLLAADLAEVVAQHAPRGGVVLAGHSMGVMVITALAGLRPDLFGEQVRASVLVAGNAGELTRTDFGLGALVGSRVHEPGLAGLVLLGRLPLVERAIGFSTYVAIARMLMCDESASHEVLRVCAAMVSQTRLSVLGEYAEAMYDHDEVAALPALGRAACLVLAAAQDRFIPASHTEQLAELVPGAELSVTEHCGHMLPLEHPGVVDDALARAVLLAQEPERARRSGAHGST